MRRNTKMEGAGNMNDEARLEYQREQNRRDMERQLFIKEYGNRCVNNDGPAVAAGGLCAGCDATARAAEAASTESSAWRDPKWLGSDQFDSVLKDDTGSGDGSTSLDELEDDDQDPLNPDDHHIYPRQFEDDFRKAGIRDIDEHTATMYKFQHSILHSEGWNADWNMFFEVKRLTGIAPNAAEVIEYGRMLLEKYGMSDIPLHSYRDHSGDLGDHML